MIRSPRLRSQFSDRFVARCREIKFGTSSLDDVGQTFETESLIPELEVCSRAPAVNRRLQLRLGERDSDRDERNKI